MSEDQTEPLADEALARLTIYTNQGSAEELAEQIGAVPDESWNTGDLNRHDRPLTSTAISFRSQLAAQASPSEHLADLIARIEPLKESLRVAVENGCTARLKLAVFADTDNAAFMLPADLLRRVGSLGFDLSLDVYDV